MPVFSVIIPLYNKQDNIAETLNSVFSQDFSDFEVLVIDDGSTDNSAKIVKSFNAPQLHYVYKENGGVSSARNKGIDLAKGNLIAFIDADDFWMSNHLSELYKLHIDFPKAGLLAARYSILFSENKFIKPHFKNLEKNYRGIVNDYFEASMPFRVATASSVVVTKEALHTTGRFSTILSNGEDNDMWTRIALHYAVAITNEYTALYNFYIVGTLSKKKMSERNLPDFKKFNEAEKTNRSLKNFLDLYRKEYALNLKAEGNPLWKFYHGAIAAENISTTEKIAFLLPPALLRFLKKIKKTIGA